ncbi:MAG: PD-(D/E)XK nuclease family protein [Burkholderiaceae bacterium]|jgi:hypothetical protein|nr:PD-(D/E)XK nuclease family protein [Burkholderiaceae bacterium]MEB2352100.1 hypothetical protein [Burkholderiaceae bacterium]
MTTIIRVPDVCERDIDLLLLEEFVASPTFRSWFLSQIGIEQTTDLTEAFRSVKTMNGESDLELTFHGSSELVKILIENKVDAAFQPNQPQRYAERAGRYRSLGTYREVLTVIMAPEVYFGDEGSAFGFDARVTYEDALAWFEQAEIGARKDYKLAILRNAIDRGRLGWKLVPHHGVSDFWKAYWELCEQIAPQLSMPVPRAEIPADSHFIGFKPAFLPAGVSLWHKVAYGHVDLQFAGMGDKLAEMEQLYRSSLLPSMRIEKAAKSAVIRVRVEPVDMTVAVFSSAETSIRQGIQAATLLLDWYSKVQQLSGKAQPNNGLQDDAPQAARA